MKITFSQIQDKINSSSLKSKFHVQKIGVFGSVVRAENTDKSDVDMLVQFTKPIGMFAFIELEKFFNKSHWHKSRFSD